MILMVSKSAISDPNAVNPLLLLVAVVFSIIGLIAGFFIGRAKGCGKKNEIKKRRIKLEDIILGVSLVGAVGCLIASMCGETQISIQILGFYVSFIFSWLLTKKN